MFERNKDEAEKLRKEMEEKEARYRQIIGHQSYEIDWLKKNLASNSTIESRKTMAEPGNQLITLLRQATLLNINRTSIYRKPANNEWSEIDLAYMRLINEICSERPFYGYRSISETMRQRGRHINRTGGQESNMSRMQGACR